MNYMGGKYRQGPKIAQHIRKVLHDDQWYVEPFCGALGVASRVAHDKMILADISEPLVNMWRAFQDPTLELPDVITEDEYNAVKAAKDPSDWRTAYYGFGMSFGSKYWGGYARNASGTDYAANLKRSTNLKRSATSRAMFSVGGYSDINIPPYSVVYCDPPYIGRTKPHDCPPFDHGEFWLWCRNMARDGHIVLVTEFIVPDDFVVIHDFGDTVVRHHAGLPPDGTREVLVCHMSQAHLFNTAGGQK